MIGTSLLRVTNSAVLSSDYNTLLFTSSPGETFANGEIAIAVVKSGAYAGTIHVAYGDMNSTEVWYLKSTDAGLTWTSPLDLRSVSGSTSYRSRVGVEFNHNDNKLYVVWFHKVDASNKYITKILSSDNGASWGTPVISTVVIPDNYNYSFKTISSTTFSPYILYTWYYSSNSKYYVDFMIPEAPSGNIQSIADFSSTTSSNIAGQGADTSVFSTKTHVAAMVGTTLKYASKTGSTWTTPVSVATIASTHFISIKAESATHYYIGAQQTMSGVIGAKLHHWNGSAWVVPSAANQLDTTGTPYTIASAGYEILIGPNAGEVYQVCIGYSTVPTIYHILINKTSTYDSAFSTIQSIGYSTLLLRIVQAYIYNGKLYCLVIEDSRNIKMFVKTL